MTATFAHHKLGLLTPGGALPGGARARRRHRRPGEPRRPRRRLGAAPRGGGPRRSGSCRARPGAHKNSAGHVVVVAGSPGKIGAPQLVAHGAMRAGAGLATIATWPDAASAIEANVLEVMTARIDPEEPGREPRRDPRAQAGRRRRPGLRPRTTTRGRRSSTCSRRGAGPIVVDADALTMFAGRPSVFMAAKKAILTPHPGELARLLGKTTAEVEADRFRAAREARGGDRRGRRAQGGAHHRRLARLAAGRDAGRVPRARDGGLRGRARRDHRRDGVPRCRRSRPRAPA